MYLFVHNDGVLGFWGLYIMTFKAYASTLVAGVSLPLLLPMHILRMLRYGLGRDPFVASRPLTRHLYVTPVFVFISLLFGSLFSVHGNKVSLHSVFPGKCFATTFYWALHNGSVLWVGLWPLLSLIHRKL